MPRVACMEIFIVLVAFSLAMDSFSVSIAGSLISERFRIRDALKVASSFGFFQTVMPIIGWFAGMSVIDLIADFDHWVAFALLLIIGCRMIHESVCKRPDERRINIFNPYLLLVLSVATSIDALAAGLSLSLLEIQIFTPAAVTGLVTFLLSLLGLLVGRRSRNILLGKVEVVGGLILICLGIKILIEHLMMP